MVGRYPGLRIQAMLSVVCTAADDDDHSDLAVVITVTGGWNQ